MSDLLNPPLATRLSDARGQVHHAIQLATAAGISYLPHQPDDSHTNLEWIDARGMLASNVIPGRQSFRVAVDVAGLVLTVLDRQNSPLGILPLDGQTVLGAADWLRSGLGRLGVDPGQYTLPRHYTIPHHAVDDGRSFDAGDRGAFGQLALWFATAAQALERVRRDNPGASDVRCWPHHFDIATLIDVAPGKTIGVGMEPGDVYYDEPYFYVNLHPQPAAPPAAPLAGGGSWHTHEWIGAVLPVSRLSASNVAAAVREFLDSSIAALLSS